MPGRPLTVQAADSIRSGAAAPELLDIEVVHVVRRLCRVGEIGDSEGITAIEFLMRLPMPRRSHRPYLPRIWELRHNLTAYEATYVALAEALRCPLVTTDVRLAAAAGIRCEVHVLGT